MKKQKKVRLNLEGLSERINPDVTGAYANISGGFVFRVTGDATEDNQISLETEVGSDPGSLTGVRILGDHTDSGAPYEIFIPDADIEALEFELTRTFLGFQVITGSGEDFVTATLLDNYSLIASTGGDDDFVQGSAKDDTIDAGSGDNTVFGNAGNDAITTGGGEDFVQGGSGNDTVNAGAGDDDVDGQAGDDVLNGEGDEDFLTGGTGNDAMDGGQGDDIVNADAADFTGPADIIGGGNDPSGTGQSNLPDVLNISSNTGQNVTYTNNGFETINGGAGNETVNGGAGAQTINGGAGNDNLDGGAGDDTLNGGAGDDTVEGGAGADNVAGGTGSDTLSYFDSAAGVFVILGNAGGSTLATGGDATGDTTAGDFENLSGSNNDADNLFGNNAANVISGNGGDDNLNGQAGNDTVNGGAGDDTMSGGNNDDDLNGGADDDEMGGGNGNDDLDGGSGNDSLEGGRNNDTMSGGTGDDDLDGGLGMDQIRIDASGTSTPAFASENDRYFGSADGDEFRVENAWDVIILVPDNPATPANEEVSIRILNTARVNATLAELSDLADNVPPDCDYDTAVDTLFFHVP